MTTGKAKWLHELADTDAKVAQWREVHAKHHAEGKLYGGAKRPWPKCTVCQREILREER